MKRTLVILMLLITSNAYAARYWSSISEEDQVYLAKNLKIKNSEASFALSSKFKVTKITSMKMINVYLFKVKAVGCTTPQETSELELYPITYQGFSSTVGIELLRIAYLKFMLKTKTIKLLVYSISLIILIIGINHRKLAAAFEMIVGIHSIAAALANPLRSNKELVATEEALIELRKLDRSINAKENNGEFSIKLVSKHKLQELAQQTYKSLKLEYQRVPSQLYLTCDPLAGKDSNWVLEKAKCAGLRLICLDQGYRYS